MCSDHECRDLTSLPGQAGPKPGSGTAQPIRNSKTPAIFNLDAAIPKTFFPKLGNNPNTFEPAPGSAGANSTILDLQPFHSTIQNKISNIPLTTRTSKSTIHSKQASSKNNPDIYKPDETIVVQKPEIAQFTHSNDPDEVDRFHKKILEMEELETPQ
jgi:hypothetical protein